MLAPAKINLSLNITGKRDDGYHLLHSYVAFADYGDEIILEPSHDGYSLSIDGPFAYQVTVENNILNKVVEGFETYLGHQLCHKIKLIKNIPVGAGLGGGSSDAAATVKLFMQEYKVEIAPSILNEMLLSLGADVPVCYQAEPCLMEGIGDIISSVSRADKVFYAVLIYPNSLVSTPKVFKNYMETEHSLTKNEVEELWFNNISMMRNDLTEPAIQIEPSIKQALKTLENKSGRIAARMTGSGSACFGLFENNTQRDKATEIIQQENPEWWVQSVSINI